MNNKEIVDWIINVGGIFTNTSDNHFGGPPDVNSQLNLMIQQRPAEISDCIAFFLNKKNSGDQINYYAEIGPCAGGTTYAMNHFLQFKEILTIDVDNTIQPDYYVGRGVLNRAHNLKDIPKIELVGLSNDPNIIDQALTLSKNQQYDILLIDGDHSYEGVKNDTINYLPIIRPGGYFIFHDTAHIVDIMKWISEISNELPNLTKVAEFHYADQYTSAFPNGIGLTVFQKTY